MDISMDIYNGYLQLICFPLFHCFIVLVVKSSCWPPGYQRAPGMYVIRSLIKNVARYMKTGVSATKRWLRLWIIIHLQHFLDLFGVMKIHLPAILMFTWGAKFCGVPPQFHEDNILNKWPTFQFKRSFKFFFF